MIVLDIDVAQRRISLGHKQVSTDPWSKVAEVYSEGSEASGVISEINDGGVVVDLPLDVEAFVPASHLQRGGRPADAYQIGDELELQVIRMDREDRELVMSETAKARAEERAARDAEFRDKRNQEREERRQVESYGASQSGPATLGELSGLAALREQMAAAEANAASQDAANEPPQTVGQANTDLAGQVGEGNRVESEEVPRGAEEETRERVEDTGATPSSANAQAALKSGDEPAEGSLASATETAIGEETEATAQTDAVSVDVEGPGVETPADVDVPEVLEVPAGEIVDEAYGDDEAPEPGTELGGASATIEGDLDEASDEK